jgi:membrane protein DedA with SNARE-associated domain
METGFDWVSRYGDAAIFLLLMLGIFGLPVPDETLLTFAGYLCFKGTLALGPTLAAAFLGSGCGITLSYGLGRLLGVHAVRRLGPVLHLRQEHLAKTQQWFEDWGKYVLIIGYFVPGVRHFTGIVAGASKLSPVVFARFAYAGALVWSSSFITLGYVVGEQWKRLYQQLEPVLLVGATMVILGLAVTFLVIGRRAKPD